MIVAGKVKNINNGRTVTRNNPKTIATYIADSGFANATPGKKCANAITAKAVNNILKMVFMCIRVFNLMSFLQRQESRTRTLHGLTPLNLKVYLPLQE